MIKVRLRRAEVAGEFHGTELSPAHTVRHAAAAGPARWLPAIGETVTVKGGWPDPGGDPRRLRADADPPPGSEPRYSSLGPAGSMERSRAARQDGALPMLSRLVVGAERVPIEQVARSRRRATTRKEGWDAVWLCHRLHRTVIFRRPTMGRDLRPDAVLPRRDLRERRSRRLREDPLRARSRMTADSTVISLPACEPDPRLRTSRARSTVVRAATWRATPPFRSLPGRTRSGAWPGTRSSSASAEFRADTRG